MGQGTRRAECRSPERPDHQGGRCTHLSRQRPDDRRNVRFPGGTVGARTSRSAQRRAGSSRTACPPGVFPADMASDPQGSDCGSVPGRNGTPRMPSSVVRRLNRCGGGRRGTPRQPSRDHPAKSTFPMSTDVSQQSASTAVEQHREAQQLIPPALPTGFIEAHPTCMPIRPDVLSTVDSPSRRQNGRSTTPGRCTQGRHLGIYCSACGVAAESHSMATRKLASVAALATITPASADSLMATSIVTLSGLRGRSVRRVSD